MAPSDACLERFLPPKAVAAQPRVAEPIGIFCKSFVEDFSRLRRMLDSMARFNVERIPFALSLPAQDIAAFRERFPDADFQVAADHELTGFRQDAIGGWHYQQMVKLCCDRTGVAENLFVVDSDFYFIRPFRRAEFLDRDGTAFLRASPHGHRADQYGLKEVLRQLETGQVETLSETTAAKLRGGRFPDLTGDLRALRQRLDGTNFSAAFGHEYIPYHCMSGPVLQAPVLRLIRAQAAAVPADAPDGAVPRLLVDLSPWEYHWHAEYLFASTLEVRLAPLAVFHVPSSDALEVVRQHRITDERLSPPLHGRRHGGAAFRRTQPLTAPAVSPCTR